MPKTRARLGVSQTSSATMPYGSGPKPDKKYFKQAYQVYSMFWGIKFGLIDAKNVKKIDKPWSMEDLVSKMVDCCRE